MDVGSLDVLLDAVDTGNDLVINNMKSVWEMLTLHTRLVFITVAPDRLVDSWDTAVNEK